MAIELERIRSLLNPTSIALVGASDDSPWSQGFVRNLGPSGPYSGKLHLVNPRRSAAFGEPCYPSIAEVPDTVDHAVLLVSAARVRDVLAECAAAGVASATVIASGFDETGPTGAALGAQVRRTCVENGIALIGPNCFGFNNYAGTYVSRYNVPVPVIPGRIGLTFQSGQLGAATADDAYARGIRLRYLVSSGNELVVDSNDLLDFFLHDPEIDVLGGVLERIPEPPRFADIARRARTAGKPIVLLKPGKSIAAQRIAIAHTGAVAGHDAIADAFLADLGVIRVTSVEELIETAGLLSRRGIPQGVRTAFIGTSGGAAELFAEQAHETVLQLDQFSPDLRDRLAELTGVMPSSIHNPFDMTADGVTHFDEIATLLTASRDYDILVAQSQPKRPGEPPDGFLDTFRSGRENTLTGIAADTGVFTVFHQTGDAQPGLRQFANEPSHGSHYVLGENGVRSIGNAAWYGRSRRDRMQSGEPVPDLHRRLPPGFSDKKGALTEHDGKSLLRAYGIPVSRDLRADTADRAAMAAKSLGFPVVLKVLSPDIAHKSEAGAVMLNLTSARRVRLAYSQLMRNVHSLRPDARVEGVLVSRQVSGGREFLAGVASDPALGHAVVAGLGGIHVETLADIRLAMAPCTPASAREQVARLKSFPLLRGTRGQPALDVDAYVDVLVRLGLLAHDLGSRLVEIDINPLFVFSAGRGVLAVDALVVLASD